jgi:CheY-like chemotaxis protein
MTRILLVDDDVELCEMLAEYLGPEGFEVELVHDGDDGARQAAAGHYDAVTLDVMLPRLNGFDALRRIRADSRVRCSCSQPKAAPWTAWNSPARKRRSACNGGSGDARRCRSASPPIQR